MPPIVEFTIKELVHITQQVLSGQTTESDSDPKDPLGPPLPPAFSTMDVRTIRFYGTQGLLKKPRRVGRENRYALEQLKSLLAIRILQSRGHSLAQIKADPRTPEQVLSSNGFDPQRIELFVKKTGVQPSFSPRPPLPSVIQINEKQANPNPPAKETVPMSRITVPHQWIRNSEKSEIADMLLETTGIEMDVKGQEFNEWCEHIRLGKAFLFITELLKSDPKAAQLHRILNGQRAPAGAVEEAVLPVPPEGLDFPGAHATLTVDAQNLLAFLLPDKDVYRAGDEVSRLFVYKPFTPNTKTQVAISLDGSKLDELDVDLDANGCGLVPYPVMTQGRFEARVEGTEAECSFEGAGYELAPLTVTLQQLERKGSSLSLKLRGESFGSPYEGKATVTFLENLLDAGSESIEFIEGHAALAWDVKKLQGSLALRIQDATDPDLACGVPLPGSSKAERDETVLSRLGRVTTVSLLPAPGTFAERGLQVLEGAVTNSVVAVERCVDRELILTFRQAFRKANVLLRDPLSGREWVHELGDCDADQRTALPVDAPFVVFYVGGFMGVEAWEGSGVFLRRAERVVDIEAPRQLLPGDRLEVKLRARGRASVLLKVLDKRMRTRDEPLTAGGRIVKQWAEKIREDDEDGIVTNRPEKWHPHLVFGSASGPATMNQRIGVDALMMSSAEFSGKSQSEDYSLEPSAIKFCAPEESTNEILFDDMSTDACGALELCASEDDDLSATPEPEGRTSEADLLFCDLVQVVGESTLTIPLPDTIGTYDIQAFGVCEGDWSEARADLRVEKESYLEPQIPQIAHPDDGLLCRATGVRAPEGATFTVHVDGQAISFENTSRASSQVLQWPAKTGVHTVRMLGPDGTLLDKIVRVVEVPGEESIIAQEMRILRAGERFDLENEDALSVKVMPGIQSELTLAVNVVTGFGHDCCEQSAAKIGAACVAVMVGDEASKEKGCHLIVKGAQRMKSMWKPGKGFRTYPEDTDIIEEWSHIAARRLANLSMIGQEAHLGREVRKAIGKMVEMGQDVLKAHGNRVRSYAGKMEQAFYGSNGKTPKITEADARIQIEALRKDKLGPYSDKSEAAFCAAVLIRAKRFDLGLEVANAVAESMGGTMGGGMHGSYEALAYMHMVDEMRKAGVAPGADGRVKVDGREYVVADARRVSDVTSVEALEGAVAIKIERLQRIRFDEVRCEVPIELELVPGKIEKRSKGLLKRLGLGARTETKGGALQAGRPATLRVKLTKGYQSGDLVCVQLPPALSRMIGGAKMKRFQIDFAGQDQVEIELVVHGATGQPQRWAAVVRNMYDSARIGSAGVQEVVVG